MCSSDLRITRSRQRGSDELAPPKPEPAAQVELVFRECFALCPWDQDGGGEPVLTPLAVDPGHPFPYISSLSLNLGVIVRDPTTDLRRFARVKVPSLLPRFVVMPDGERFVPLEQVIAHHLDELFPGMEVLQHHARPHLVPEALAHHSVEDLHPRRLNPTAG